MSLTVFEILSIIGTIFGILGTILTLYFRWKTSRPKQPFFLISNVRVTNPWNPREEKKPLTILKILFRNTGDKSTVFNIRLKLSIIIPKQNRQLVSITSYEFPLSPDQNHDKGLSFEIDENAEEWENGFLEIMGYYLDSRDKKRVIREFFFGSNIKDEQWIHRYSIRSPLDRMFFVLKFKSRFRKNAQIRDLFHSITIP